MSFYSGIPSGKTIKGVFQAALKGGKIRNLTESNTNYTVTFTGKWRKWISIKLHLTPKYFFRLNKSLHLFETHSACLN